MKQWLKRLIVVLTIPFVTLALTACPGPDDNGAQGGEPTIEGELEDAGESIQEGAEDAGEAIEEGAEDAGQAIEEGVEDVEDEIEDAEDDAAN